MKNKKELAIVFGITSNLTFALANVILGLKKHSPELADEIIVFHDDISEKDQDLIKSIFLSRFIKYEFPVKDTSKFDPYFYQQFSSMAYSRFECFKLLNEFKKVLWLDVDILIQKDISGLLEYENDGMGILEGYRVKDNFKEPVEGFDMEKEGFWTGTILFTDKIKDYDKITDWCYEKLIEYSDKLYLPDQAIFNIALEKFNINPAVFDNDFYCAHPISKTYKTAAIVHAFRPKKFWDCWNFKEWDENDKIWQQMGGTPYKGKKFPAYIRLIEIKFPGAPHPIKKPRGFVKFIWKTRLRKKIQRLLGKEIHEENMFKGGFN